MISSSGLFMVGAVLLIDPYYGSCTLIKSVVVFDLPPELLATLHLKTAITLTVPEQSKPLDESSQDALGNVFSGEDGSTKPATSCPMCGVSFANVQEQRQHIRSDWHGYNLKQKLRGSKAVTELEFDQLVEDLDESISGSESSQSENEEERQESTLSALLKKQARIHHTEPDLEDHTPRKRKRGSGKPPQYWFSTPLLPSNTSLGIYRALFTDAEQQDESRITKSLEKKQLTPSASKAPPDGSNGVPLPSTMTSPQIFLCMIGGGHFAAMVVSLAPKTNRRPGGVEERQAIVIAHKTFHRYTTRRKQGGAQSANDSAKGAAHSAGASIRRYNEMALETEIRALLSEWKEMIDKSQLIFVRATGSSNRRTIFGPYDGQVLRHNDPRNRTFPFSTRRATQAELMRAFIELTRVKVSEVDEAALAAAAAAEAEREASGSKPSASPSKPPPPKPSKEEEAALLHTSQLQALIRRNKAPAVLSYLTNNSLNSDFLFQPEDSNTHAPTSLFFASSKSSAAVVLALLTKGSADPTTFNGDDKVPFNLAGDRATRDAFRIARHELGEDCWDWTKAQCPPPLSKTEADQREERARMEEEKAEAERRKAETERLKRESAEEAKKEQAKKMSGRALGAMEKTRAEKREEEARGMTTEMRTRLERERRARAAEERIRGMSGRGGAGR